MKKRDSANITIATVIQNLLKRSFTAQGPDDYIVIDALRRSKSSLSCASPTELGDYLERLSPDQLKGVANNVKGIFHELKYIDYINSSDLGLHAEIYQETNHPGADIRVVNVKTGELVRELQLKATESTAYIQEHIQRYPHIDVAATSEIAERLQGIESTGFSNADLTSQTSTSFEEIEDLSINSQIEDSLETSVLLSAAFQASQVLTGKKKMAEASKDALINIGIATSTTALVAYLFG